MELIYKKLTAYFMTPPILTLNFIGIEKTYIFKYVVILF